MRRANLTTAAVFLLVTVLTGTALAAGYSPAKGDIASGTISERVDIRSHPGATTRVIVQELTIPEGAGPTWHTHPGQVIVVVESGEFVVNQAQGNHCETVTYKAGDAFVDPGGRNVHRGTAVGGPVTLTATYLIPDGEPRTVIPLDPPRACAS